MIAPRAIAGSLLLGIAVAATAAPFRATPGLGRSAGASHPAVCRVAVEERDGQAFGSGTLIDARERYGLVITNWHVVRDATGKIEVRFPGGFKSEARPLKLDETWDLAALVVWRPPTEPVSLAGRSPVKGEPLTICGYGSGDYLSQTGRCTDYYAPEVGQPQELVELNVEARQGDSGGPIFNSRGELAGVLFGAARGTTLGSFGPRVQTFLASLAPNIGTKQQTLLAAAPPSQRRPPPMGHAALSAPTPLDPFLAAELIGPKQSTALSEGLSALAETQPPVTRQPSVPPPALTDRSSAPRLAAARAKAEAWQPVPKPSPAVAFAPPRQSKPIGNRFAPETTLQATEPSAAGLAGSVDWAEDSRTLLAVLGAAALVVAGMRAVS